MELKQLCFGKALDHVIGQILTVGMRRKLGNPFWRLIYSKTGYSPSFTNTERCIDDNCSRLRALARNYLQTHVNDVSKERASDLVSLFRQTPEVFTDEFIIDELMDFFLAGVTTSTNAGKTFVAHFAASNESVLKLRNEFKEVSRESETYDPKDDNLSKLDYLKKHATW